MEYRIVSNETDEGQMNAYTEWCMHCGAETEYSSGWRMIQCSGCGRMLMPCDWCMANGHNAEFGCLEEPCALAKSEKFKKPTKKICKSANLTIKMDWDTFEELLRSRNEEWGNAPEYVVDYYINKLRENGGCRNCQNNDPKTIMDNLAVNGSYGPFETWQRRDELDDDFIDRMMGDYPDAVVFKDKRVMILPSPTMEDIIYG